MIEIPRLRQPLFYLLHAAGLVDTVGQRAVCHAKIMTEQVGVDQMGIAAFFQHPRGLLIIVKCADLKDLMVWLSDVTLRVVGDGLVENGVIFAAVIPAADQAFVFIMIESGHFCMECLDQIVPAFHGTPPFAYGKYNIKCKIMVSSTVTNVNVSFSDRY